MLLGLNHITIAVATLERSLAFYTEVLSFKAHVKWDKGAYLSIGELWLCLTLDKPSPKDDYSHIAFSIAEKDFKTFSEYIKINNIKQWKNNGSEGHSLYILDPDGHKLEIHVGSLSSRLNSLKTKPYKGLEWL